MSYFPPANYKAPRENPAPILPFASRRIASNGTSSSAQHCEKCLRLRQEVETLWRTNRALCQKIEKLSGQAVTLGQTIEKFSGQAIILGQTIEKLSGQVITFGQTNVNLVKKITGFVTREAALLQEHVKLQKAINTFSPVRATIVRKKPTNASKRKAVPSSSAPKRLKCHTPSESQKSVINTVEGCFNLEKVNQVSFESFLPAEVSCCGQKL